MIPVFIMYFDILLTSLLHFMITQLQIYTNILKKNVNDKKFNSKFPKTFRDKIIVQT